MAAVAAVAVIGGGHFCDAVTVTRPPEPMAVIYKDLRDGPLLWACPACNWAWPAVSPDDRLRTLAEQYVTEWNKARRTTAP